MSKKHKNRCYLKLDLPIRLLMKEPELACAISDAKFWLQIRGWRCKSITGPEYGMRMVLEAYKP